MVRAGLRQIVFDPDPRTLPGDAASFAFGARLMIGPLGGPGEESFDLTVCSPEWLAERCRDGEPFNGLHHVIVDWESFDERVLRRWLADRVQAVEAASWQGIADRLGRLGWWEFEEYREHTQPLTKHQVRQIRAFPERSQAHTYANFGIAAAMRANG